MFSFKWKELNPLKLVLNLFGKKQYKPTESPWLEGLERLAAQYGENPMRTTTFETKSDAALEAEAQLRQLCSDVQEDLEESDRIVVHKERRQGSTTSVDLKAWWGQSVATWDPIDEKNLDSINQQRRPRKAKWFDNGPGSDLGRP